MTAPDFDLLPDGRRFAFWDCRTTFTRTWHVAAAHPRADDAGAGTAEAPFRTIGRAAQTAQPGERILIGDGLYRECVRPARGGTSAEAMISYEAAPGAKPVISGAEAWTGPWEPSEGWRFLPWDKHQPSGQPGVWMGALPPQAFAGYNPFGMVNAPSTPWGGDHFFVGLPGWMPRDEFMMRRGQLFVDGAPLKQVRFPTEKGLDPGCFWVEDDGLRLHFRLADDTDPRNHRLEFTAREQCFSPEKPYQAFIRVRGLAFEKSGNGLPPPQRGALSAHCGHHWIIEDCSVRWANTIGMDLGHQSPSRISAQVQGHHIVRRNLVTDCGVCGICAVAAGIIPTAERPDPLGYPIQIPHLLVEWNRFERNGWRDVESLCESGSLKIHSMHDCLVRHNLILDHIHGPGLWADWQNANTRICSNAIIGTRFTHQGGMFIEASKLPNLVDNNLVWDVGQCPSVGGDKIGGGHGIFSHDCEHLTVRHNFISGATRAGVCMHRGDPNRITYGRGSTGRKNQVFGNIIDRSGWAVILANPDNECDGNRYGSFVHDTPWLLQHPEERLSLPGWQEFHGWDRTGKRVRIEAKLDREQLKLAISIDGAARNVDLTTAFWFET